MNALKQWGKTLLTLFLLLLTLAPAALANSAEPPGLTVIVPFAPKDLSLSLRMPDGAEAVLERDSRGWETYYRFHYWTLMAPNASLEGAVLVGETGTRQFTCPLPDGALGRYNNVCTLDWREGRLEIGERPGRTPLLIALRVGLTLLTEGFVFYLFGYRKKTSWALFLAANLVTQGALNVLLSGVSLGTYWIIGFVVLEGVIFVSEGLFFLFALREKGRLRAALCALTANAFSLGLGFLLLSRLPV